MWLNFWQNVVQLPIIVTSATSSSSSSPLKVRVKKDPKESQTSLASTCDESTQYGREQQGHLVGSYRFEDSYCARSSPSVETALNFDLPFAMSLHHGQVIVKIAGSQMQSRGIIKFETIKLQGIEDIGKTFISKDVKVAF